MYAKGLSSITTDILLMESTTFNNVSEVLSRVVKSDGRCGGLQRYAGKSVDIVIYENVETEPDRNEEEEGN